MSVTFNIFEIFEIAEQLERNGVKFYRRASDITSDEDAKKMFSSLSEMEVEHERTFGEMKRQISSKEQDLMTFDPENEMALYLQVVASGHVFDLKKDMTELLTGKESVEEILDMAIQAEKDSIAFFTGLKKLVPEPRGKEKVDEIIAEEMKHIVILNQKLSALK